MNTYHLSVESLSFQKRGAMLLNDISFKLHRGELVGIIGPNGAGKSTLLKCLIQYYQPAKGRILIDEQNIQQLSHGERAKRVAYLSQYPDAAFPFSVLDTVAMGANAWLETGQFSATEVQHKSLELMQLLDIQHLSDRKLTELSGGETQLVHFARVLMQNTELLFLDEPTASLDIGHEAQLMNLLRQQCDSGKTALVAIHNLNIAAAFCDRLLLLDSGKLITIDRPERVVTPFHVEKLYQQPILVSRHPISGTVTVLPMRERPSHNKGHVHVIGGAGSAVEISRALLQAGYKVTGGVAHEKDSDTDYWQATGITCVTVPAFATIDEATLECASALVTQADATILCDFPLGASNAGNLELAQQASQLFVVDATLDADRFFSSEVERRYGELIAQPHCQTLDSQQIIERIQKKSLLRHNGD